MEELRSAERADEPEVTSPAAGGLPAPPPSLDRARSLPHEKVPSVLTRLDMGEVSPTKGFVRSTSLPSEQEQYEECEEGRRRRRTSSVDGVEVARITEERAEETEEGSLSIRVWCAFVRAMGWGVWVVIATNCVSTAGYLLSALWIGHWPELSEQMGTTDALLVYALISFSIVVFTAMRLLVFQYSSLRLSRNMHQKALWAVIRSPMAWHDTTPTGRVVNRFSSDLQKVDTDLQNNVVGLLRSMFDMLASFLVVLFVVPLIFVVVVPTLAAYFWIQKLYRKSGREIQRMASKSYSPIYQGVDEAINGVATIRAYEKQQYFSGRTAARVSRSVRLDLTLQGCQRWLGFRLKMLGACISSMVALLVVLHAYLGPLGRSISGPAAGVALRYAQQLSNALESILNNLTSTEQCLVAVERLTTYSEMPDEGELETQEALSSVEGSVRFENVFMRYRPELPTVLKGLTFSIPGGSSLGVVGRTGAGKSSLLQALFRMCPIESGTIHLYGKDVSGLGLHTLRKALAIIPQDPVGFTGTVRFNLDPFMQNDDTRIWGELEKVQLKAHFEAKAEGLGFMVTAGGENLSVGQRQLLCCARALIRGARILVLDEATASVDFTTDALIQQVLRKEVETQQLTTITIAHRISTILGADRVLVMEEGQAAEFGPTQDLAATPTSKFAALVTAAQAAEKRKKNAI
ncbi:abcC12 [Symbiodinium natans]|uniref:AbcC12 protein n=1 Tax=Symbiodinium natans TaxID=878477 RepID=A0A812MFF5_9DINO|nr:abcC12 [Symbiodinium natans]